MTPHRVRALRFAAPYIGAIICTFLWCGVVAFEKELEEDIRAVLAHLETSIFFVVYIYLSILGCYRISRERGLIFSCVLAVVAVVTGIGVLFVASYGLLIVLDPEGWGPFPGWRGLLEFLPGLTVEIILECLAKMWYSIIPATAITIAVMEWAKRQARRFNEEARADAGDAAVDRT